MEWLKIKAKDKLITLKKFKTEHYNTYTHTSDGYMIVDVQIDDKKYSDLKFGWHYDDEGLFLEEDATSPEMEKLWKGKHSEVIQNAINKIFNENWK